MKERPILMSAPMVNALLEGRKTQTRRAVKGLALEWLKPGMFTREYVASPENHLCPYGQPGDRLWVREAHYLTDNGDSEYAVYAADGDAVREHLTAIAELPGWFPEGVKERHRKLRPSIFMPRWASRILLEITDIRVERLQDISEEDAKAEGLMRYSDGWRGAPNLPWYASPVGAYRSLFESINGSGSWDLNPWVRVISFKKVNHEE